MKLMSCRAISLCVAGGVLTVPCWAQEDISPVPDVRVETRVVQTPQVHVETRVDAIPEITIVQQSQTRGSNNSNSAAVAARAQSLQQYASGQVVQNLNYIFSPEMGKKTREIALLRQMLALKLTARDIEKAIPLLKEMKDSDNVAPVKPEQAIEEEIQRLLEAKPGDPMPPSSAEALRDAANGFRTRKQAIWDKMAQAIGKDKATGIRRMLRSDGTSFWSTSSSFQGLFTAPDAYTPYVTPQYRYKLEKVAPVKPAPAPDKDTAPPDAPPAAKPADDDAAPVPAPRVRQPRKPADADNSDDDTAAAAAASRQAEREAQRAATRAQRASPPTPPSTVIIAPGARAQSLNSNGYRTQLIYGMYGQATLDELIALFEKKLVAMRH